MVIANQNARKYVENRQVFTGSHTFSEYAKNKNGGELYVVFSYGYHFPLFVFTENQWYFNKDKYSVTTSKHKSQLRPNVTNFIELNTQELKEL